MKTTLQTHSKRPIFGVASWLLPAAGSLIAYFVINAARARGGFLPGLFEVFASALAITFCAFICGLTAVLRHERFRWLGIIPLLAGLCGFAFYSWIWFH
jgi:hypothetical protein